MATYVKGDAVANATSYELLEKTVTSGEMASVTKVLADETTCHTSSKLGKETCEIVEGSGYHVYADFPVVVGKKYMVSSGCYRTWLLDAEGNGLVNFSFQDYTTGYTVTNENAAVMRLTFTGSTLDRKDTITYEDEVGGEATYNTLATANEINFNLSEQSLAAGSHTLVVKAKGDGVNYLDSDYSNEVVYTAE